MTPEQDDELLLNVPSSPIENETTYVALHKAADSQAGWRLIALIVSLALAWLLVR